MCWLWNIIALCLLYRVLCVYKFVQNAIHFIFCFGSHVQLYGILFRKPKVSLRSTRSRSSSIEVPRLSHRRTFSNTSDKSPSLLSSRRVFSTDPSTQYSKKNNRSRDSSIERGKKKTQHSTWLPRSRDSSVERSLRSRHVSSHSRDSSLECVQRNDRRNGGLHSLHSKTQLESKENCLQSTSFVILTFWNFNCCFCYCFQTLSTLKKFQRLMQD